MINPMDMTDEKFRLYQARQRAAQIYRSNGFHGFAQRVEAELEDECSQMRIARFFIDPPREPGPEFIAAWNEMAAADMTTSRRGH
jgi:hypothetical protein